MPYAIWLLSVLIGSVLQPVAAHADKRVALIVGNSAYQHTPALKNPGNALNPTTPSPNTAITFNRYHVDFRRTDGRNTQGVDVPYSFDGAATFTVPADGQAQFAVEIVRNQAKLESPLVNLRQGGGGIIISTIAEITFYGRDQVGNEVVATGQMSVNFGDFADPS